MDLLGGTPFWLLARGLRTIAPPLERDCSCDVAIIGTGITGAMLAWALVNRGRRVVMLDRRDLGQGSTMASTALLMYELDVPLYQLERGLGPARARRAFHIGIEAIHAIGRMCETVGVPFRRMPSLYVARTARRTAELRHEFAARRDARLPVHWVASGELASRWGVKASAAIRSTVAAQIDPFELTHALLAQARRRGVSLHDRTDVVHIDAAARSVRLVVATGHVVRARHVVHASGYEAAERIPPGLVRLSSSYAVISEPSPRGATRRCVLWERADPYLYVRWAGDRLLVGGEDKPFIDPDARDRIIPRQAARLVAKVSRLMPGLRFHPAFAWAGVFGSTPDGLGYIGSMPGRPREHFALGFGGNGITFASVAADLITDTITGARLAEPIDHALFAFGRH